MSETTAASSQPLSEREWNQQQYARALKYCSDKGLRVNQFDKRNSRVLPPFLALWLVSLQDSTEKVWVLTGDLPGDHVVAKAAPKARDALKHFALSWQLKAQGLMDELSLGRASLGNPDNQLHYASLLVHRAEAMYEMSENEALWANG